VARMLRTMSARSARAQGVACRRRRVRGSYGNTMSLALEFLASARGAERDPARRPGKPTLRNSAAGLRSSSCAATCVLPTTSPASIENAIAAVVASGGSTNASSTCSRSRELGLPLELDDFDEIATRTPVVADLKPGGRFVATDLHRRRGKSRRARALGAASSTGQP